jgi:hypothetical protein
VNTLWAIDRRVVHLDHVERMLVDRDPHHGCRCHDQLSAPVQISAVRLTKSAVVEYPQLDPLSRGQLDLRRRW